MRGGELSELQRVRCSWEPCGAEYVPSKYWQRFCSEKCRMSNANARRKVAMELLGDAPIPMLSGAST